MIQAIQQISSLETEQDKCTGSSFTQITGDWLFPQWMAAYTGLKKLLEKDYHREEEDPSTLFSTLSDRLARIW